MWKRSIAYVLRRPEFLIATLVAILLLSASLIELSQIQLAGEFSGIKQFLPADGNLDEPLVRAIAFADRLDDALRQNAVLEVWLCAGVAVLLSCLIGQTMHRHRKLKEIATCDLLTGLANRRSFHDTLSTLIKDPGAGNDLAVMLVDVDHFKLINDTFGHDTGDAILKELSQRLQQLPRDGRWLFRLGGDEFAVVLTATRVYRHGKQVAQTIRELVNAPFVIGGRRVKVSLSIGISYLAQDSYSADALFKNADVALYAAKAAGRDTFRFFEAKMDADLKARLELENDLRHAIIREELELHFQPMVDLQSKELAAYEALARWKHPKFGFIPPEQFIRIAEEIGEMRALGDWIVRKAFKTALSWPDNIGVAINLSPQQFEGDSLLPLVETALRETGIQPGRIEFEITESLLINDKIRVADILGNLRTLGVRIALDDFGTGYSSMAYLHQFPIDKIKIDQSFVREMATKPEAVAIVESISFLARKLGLVTTAEGIETEAQAIFLRSMGCDEGQGYYFAKPLPAEACVKWSESSGAADIKSNRYIA